MNRRISLAALLALGSLLLAACSSDLPPRLATATALAAQTPTATAEPLHLPLDTAVATRSSSTPMPTPAVLPNPSFSLWINETSPEHETAVRAMVEELRAEAGIDLEVQFVAPNLLPDLVNTAVLSGTLPDAILHPIAYAPGWAERGILNGDIAADAWQQLDPATFDPDVLPLISNNGQPYTLPSDGYKQLIIYRTDWFAEQRLDAPDNYADMFAAAEATTDRENLRAGFVIPTESNLVTTHQAFEQIALANGCQLIDDNGEVRLYEPACTEALDFYYRIVNQFSPIGVQTDTSTQNAYLAGRTGLVMTPPTLLPRIAGLDVPPTCPECADNPAHLLENTAILTTLTGSGSTAVPSSFSEMMTLSFTQEADPETAVVIADYWFNQGYPQWLAVNSERKVPLRWGDSTDPRRFIDAWGNTPLPGSNQSLTDLFGTETVDALRQGIATAPRWGIQEGQGALVTQLYENLTLSIILQEMLSGYFTPAQTIIEAYNRVTDLIPNYPYYQDLEAEPTPENEG